MTKHHLGATFINNIKAEVLDSAAVNHPYLSALRTADFPNIDLAFKDFAYQYGLYSTAFTRYVSAVIKLLSHAEHKQILLTNLAEEKGDTHGVELPPEVYASVAGQPHTHLYRRFQEALGVNADHHDSTLSQQAGQLWRQQFLQLCETDECVGVGAIGIGTELIVSTIYTQILEGLKTLSNLTLTQRVFFDLHCECDEGHAAEMLQIAEDLAQDRTACEKIASGARQAIDLRVAFWDTMLERAHSFPASAPPTIKKLSAIEY